MKRKQILIGALILAILFVGGLFVAFHTSTAPVGITAVQTAKAVSYKGEPGKDALTLLKAETSVQQAPSGLVIRIGNRTADAAKHEYWAFYVNGKYAQVGPAAYQTKAGDTILWKIEKY